MSAFATYLLGFILLVAGLGIAAYLLNVPAVWILAAIAVLVGVVLFRVSSRARPRDPPPGQPR